MASIRISVPDTAAKGEVIELKALLQHPMESSITAFACTYDGEVVSESNFFPSAAANPFLVFYTVATQTGPMEFKWTDQNGESWSQTAQLVVT